MQSTRSVACNPQLVAVCNHFEEIYVIHRRWYVINPKEKTYKSCDLMTYRLLEQTDYILLTAITYQSFGLDKKSRSEERDFLVGTIGLEPMTLCL